MHRIYFDYNSTAPMHNEVIEEIKNSFKEIGNPLSKHYFGNRIKKYIENSRQKIADIFKIDKNRIIWTSGATEANNIALFGFNGPIIVSALTHDPVFKIRSDAIICPVDSRGILQLDYLEKLIKKQEKPPLICTTTASNQLGILQPVDEVIRVAHMNKAFVFSDASQSFSKIPVSWNALDAFSLSAHKIGGPFGSGLLIVNDKVFHKTMFKGNTQERSIRPGTHNLHGILGFSKAVEIAMKIDWSDTEKKRNLIEKSIQKYCPQSIIIGKHLPRLPNTSMISMPGVHREKQLLKFDKHGIAISIGFACSFGKANETRILKELNISRELANQCIRISLGPKNDSEDIERFIQTWCKIYDEEQENNRLTA